MNPSPPPRGREATPPWLLVGFVLVLVGASSAWFFLGRSGPGNGGAGGAGAVAPGALSAPGTGTFFAPKHMDSAGAWLRPTADGKSRVRFVLLDCVDGERYMLKIRENAADPKVALLYVQRGPPVPPPPPEGMPPAPEPPEAAIDRPGRLAADVAGTGAPGAMSLEATLPIAATRAVVFDLRWPGPRQALDIAASAAAVEPGR